METVFDCFTETEYEYLSISRGTVKGNKITGATTHKGIFKLRSGMVQGEREVANSDATLHIHPDDYENPDDLVGNGILYDGVAYRIAGVTVGTNFETGRVEHYRLTLEKENFYNIGDYL